MKHITRRNFIKASGISLATASLAACGSTTTSTSTSTSTASSTPSSVTEDGIEMIGNTYVEGLPIMAEPTTFNIMNTKGASDKSQSQNDKDIVKLTTADTNVSFTWTETSEATFKDSCSLILATGDGLPDAFLSTSVPQVDSNLDDFFQMDEETFRKYAPNISAGMDEHVAGGLSALKKTDGYIYTFPSGSWSNRANWPSCVPFIRQDWLDDLGLDMPTTIEDLYDVLVAFKKNCKSESGGAVTPFIFGQSNWAAKLQFIAGPWGIAGSGMNYWQWFGRIENGEYKLNITDQRFRDFLTEMHRWYDAGLVNIDGFSMTNSEYQSLVNSKAYGVYGTWTPTVEDWDNGVWAALPVLSVSGYEGQQLKAGQINLRTALLSTFIVTNACKDPYGLIRWWDHCHSSAEWKIIGGNGPEGNAWYYGDDGVAYVKAVDELPGECASDTEYHNTYAWRAYAPICFEGEYPIPNPDVTSEDGIRYEVSAMYEDFYPTEYIPDVAVPADVTSEFAFTKEEIENAVENFMGQSVMKGITDAEWDAYLANLEAIGIQEWITYYQNWIDQSWS